MDERQLTPDTWRTILASAYTLFDDAEARGFGTPPFALGGGTMLMLDFQHRLSKDIDFFGYDAQWITILSPRLSDAAANLARDYVEQSNVVKIVMAAASIAARAAASKRDLLARRFADLEASDPAALLAGIVPYDGRLAHADGMVAKVKTFVLAEIDRALAERSGHE